jgi:hypothetical protein
VSAKNYLKFKNKDGKVMELRGDMTLEDMVRMGFNNFRMEPNSAPPPTDPNVYGHEAEKKPAVVQRPPLRPTSIQGRVFKVISKDPASIEAIMRWINSPGNLKITYGQIENALRDLWKKGYIHKLNGGYWK